MMRQRENGQPGLRWRSRVGSPERNLALSVTLSAAIEDLKSVCCALFTFQPVGPFLFASTHHQHSFLS